MGFSVARFCQAVCAGWGCHTERAGEVGDRFGAMSPLSSIVLMLGVLWALAYARGNEWRSSAEVQTISG